MFLWWPSTKIVEAIMIHQKVWPPGGKAYFPYMSIYETSKKLFIRKYWTDFSIIWQKCSLVMFKPSWFVKKHGHQGVGLIFPIYQCRKLKIFLSETTRNFAEMCLWWPSTKIVQAIIIYQKKKKKKWPPKDGVYFLYISIKFRRSNNKMRYYLPYTALPLL